MKPHSLEFRQKIIEVHEKESLSIRKLAQRFCVAKSFIQKLLKQYIAFLRLPVKNFLSQEQKQSLQQALRESEQPELLSSSINAVINE
jgi:transposase